MPVLYNSKSIIPAPFAVIAKDYQFTEDGTAIGASYTINLKGTLVAYKGSPNSSGVMWTSSGYPPDEPTVQAGSTLRLKSILAKQAALRSLFSTNGLVLEIVPLDGSSPTSCNPRVKHIEFEEGNWFDVCKYTIVLEADSLSGDTSGFSQLITRASEQWNVESLDELKKTYRLTHACSAQGKMKYNADGSIAAHGWEQARDFVLAKMPLGFQSSLLSGVTANWTGTMNAYNYLRASQQDEQNGTFAANETWVCYDPNGGPPAIDECNISVRTNVDMSGRVTVGVEGNITGFEQRNNTTGSLTTTRYVNAESKWAIVQNELFSRASLAAGVTLNPTAVSTSLQSNDTTGVITYNWEYDNRPEPAIAGATYAKAVPSQNRAADVFADITILGRAIGPILQAIGTKTSRKTSVAVEVKMPPATMSFTPTEPDTNALVAPYQPTGSTVFVAEDTDQWDPMDGRYTRTVQWVWMP